MTRKKFPCARNAPFVLEMKPGRYAWCSCGESKKQPFCNGSHEVTGMRPLIEIITEAKTVAWCGCKSSESKPYCDGTHKKFCICLADRENFWLFRRHHKTAKKLNFIELDEAL